MARGFIQGLLLGGAVSVGTAGIASIFLPLPSAPQVSDAAPGTAQAPLDGDVYQDRDRAAMAESGPTMVLSVPQGDAPDPDTLSGLDADTTNAMAAPETGLADGLTAPAAGAEAGAVAPGADEPVLPNPQALAPMTPQEPDVLSISTDPAQPPAPEAETAAFADSVTPAETSEVPSAATAPSVSVDAPQAPVVPAEAPEMSTEVMQPETDVAPMSAPAAATVAPAQDAGPAPQANPAAPQVAEAQTAAPSPRTAKPQSPKPRTEEAPRLTAPITTQVGTPATTLTDRSSGVIINRPDTGTAQEKTTQGKTLRVQTDVPAESVDEEVTLQEMLPPLQAHAEAFDGADGKPLMGIVLIDDGTELTAGAPGISALRSFPYSLSFAVDASLPDAKARMDTYRDAGFEVLAMIDLPEGAQPSDAETTFNAIMPRMSRVVGVLENPDGSFQDSRDLSDQITAILADSGHGLITQDKGLNTMPKLARKLGVPADPVFRDFDNKGQTATVIRRFLDQAAFKAGQEGAVIMLGRLRPETISALLLWGLQARASSVALAPISAVLTRE